MIGQLWRQWEEPESQSGQVGQAGSLCSSRAHTSRRQAGGMLGVCPGKYVVLGRGNRPPGLARQEAAVAERGSLVPGMGWYSQVSWAWPASKLSWGNCTIIEVYCTVLYCTVLYCTVLYCTLLYCNVLH